MNITVYVFSNKMGNFVQRSASKVYISLLGNPQWWLYNEITIQDVYALISTNWPILLRRKYTASQSFSFAVHYSIVPETWNAGSYYCCTP